MTTPQTYWMGWVLNWSKNTTRLSLKRFLITSKWRRWIIKILYCLKVLIINLMYREIFQAIWPNMLIRLTQNSSKFTVYPLIWWAGLSLTVDLWNKTIRCLSCRSFPARFLIQTWFRFNSKISFKILLDQCLLDLCLCKDKDNSTFHRYNLKINIDLSMVRSLKCTWNPNHLTLNLFRLWECKDKWCPRASR